MNNYSNDDNDLTLSRDDQLSSSLKEYIIIFKNIMISYFLILIPTANPWYFIHVVVIRV